MVCSFQHEFERRRRTKRREIRKLQRDSTTSRELQNLNCTSSIYTGPKRRKQESTDTTTTTENDTDTDSTQPAVEQNQNVQRKVRQSRRQRACSRDQNTEKRKTRNSARDESTDSAREDNNSQDQKQTSLRTKNVESLDEDPKQIDVELSNTDHQKDPPDPPTKTRSKSSVNNLPDVVKSPLYYSLSPDVSSDGVSSTQEIKQPSVGKTPSVTSATEKVPITLRSALLKPSSTPPAGPGSTDESEGQIKDTPVTAHLKSDALAHVTEIPLSDVKKKMTKSKTLGSSPLDLQREIMSVVMTHKRERLTKMQKRRSKQTVSVNSSSTQAKPEGTDVYDLSNSPDEFEEMPSKTHLRGGVKRLTSSERQKLSRTSKVSQTPVEISATGTESDSDFTTIIKSGAKSQNAGTSVKSLNTSKSAKPKEASTVAKGSKSGGGDKLRTRNRTRTRSNENNTDVSLTSDGEEEISSRLQTSRYKGKAAKESKVKSKALPKRTLRSRKTAKQPEEITIIDSDSDSTNSESESDSDAARTSHVSQTKDQDRKKRRVSFEISPQASSKDTVVNNSDSMRSSTRQSKRTAARKIKEISSIVDSESSSTEMMSLRSRRSASMNQKRNSLLEEKNEDSSDEEVVPPPRITRKATRRIQKNGEGKSVQAKKQSVGARGRPRKNAAASQQNTSAKLSKDEVSPSTEKENTVVDKASASNENGWSAAELAKLKR